jgi:hypothetical protein
MPPCLFAVDPLESLAKPYVPLLPALERQRGAVGLSGLVVALLPFEHTPQAGEDRRLAVVDRQDAAVGALRVCPASLVLIAAGKAKAPSRGQQLPQSGELSHEG